MSGDGEGRCESCGKLWGELPADHCAERVTPWNLGTGVIGEPGPWTCREIKPLTPEEFIAGVRPA